MYSTNCEDFLENKYNKYLFRNRKAIVKPSNQFNIQ